jgi:hypothetical protein
MIIPAKSQFNRKFKMAAMTRLSLTLDPMGISLNIGPYGNFTFSSFFLKPQNRFESNLAEMFIEEELNVKS